MDFLELIQSGSLVSLSNALDLLKNSDRLYSNAIIEEKLVDSIVNAIYKEDGEWVWKCCVDILKELVSERAFEDETVAKLLQRVIMIDFQRNCIYLVKHPSDPCLVLLDLLDLLCDDFEDIETILGIHCILMTLSNVLSLNAIFKSTEGLEKVGAVLDKFSKFLCNVESKDMFEITRELLETTASVPESMDIILFFCKNVLGDKDRPTAIPLVPLVTETCKKHQKLSCLLLRDVIRVYLKQKASLCLVDVEGFAACNTSGSHAETTALYALRQLILKHTLRSDTTPIQILQEYLLQSESCNGEVVIGTDLLTELISTFVKLNENPKKILKIEQKYRQTLSTIVANMVQIGIKHRFQFVGIMMDSCLECILKQPRNFFVLMTVIDILSKQSILQASPPMMMNLRPILPNINQSTTITPDTITDFIGLRIEKMITVCHNAIEEQLIPTLKRCSSVIPYEEVQKNANPTKTLFDDALKKGIIYLLDANGLSDSIHYLKEHIPAEWNALKPKCGVILEYLSRLKRPTDIGFPLLMDRLPQPLKKKLDPIILPHPPSLPSNRPKSSRKIPVAQ